MSDDFEFKPLTEGLGFHKKVIELQDESTSFRGPLQKAIKPTVTPSPMSKPLGAQNAASTAHAGMAGASLKHQVPLVSSWNPALPKHDLKGQSKAAAPTATPARLKPVAVAWPSAIFDSTMILGMALIFSAAVFAITRIDLTLLLEMLRSDGAAQLASLFIVFCVFEIYTVACRSFFGKTMGEWAFDYRLGTPEEQVSAFYPLQVALRSLLIAVTGFIVIPALNAFAGEDLLGSVTGVSLFMETR